MTKEGVPLLIVWCYFLKQYDTSHGIKTVLSYDSFAAWKEVDLSSLMTFFPDIDMTVVARTKDATIHSTQYDIILVPLFGFTKDGYRLGHGGGWYDRVLSRQDTSLKVGVGLEEGRIDYPVEPHDIQLDVIITDQHVSLIS